jgi:hypothetical protein
MSYTAVPENSFWQGLAGTLVSPSRGLFVYIPVLAFLAYLLGRYRNTWRPGLVGLAIGVVVAHVALLSSFIGWHGGYCYGPRLSTDVVPWFALLGMLAVQARLQWHAANPARDSPLRIRTESALAGVLLICSITLHGIGALWVGASKWNVLPVPANEDSGRLWDWRHPPFFGVPRDSVTHDQKSTR